MGMLVCNKTEQANDPTVVKSSRNCLLQILPSVYLTKHRRTQQGSCH